MKTVVTFLAITLLVGSLSGCASIVSGRRDDVVISSKPSGAKFTIVNQWGDTAYIGRTPARIPLKRGAGYLIGSDYTIAFEKEGYVKSVVMIKRDINPLCILGNIPWYILAPFGWFIFDPWTGAMWTLEDNVHVNLPSLTSPESLKDGDGPHIISLYDIPANLRRSLVKTE